MLSVIKLRLLRLKDEYIIFIIMTAMALGFTAIFGASFDTYKPTIYIIDEDNSYYSEALISELNTYKDFKFKEVEIKVAVFLHVHHGFRDWNNTLRQEI